MKKLVVDASIAIQWFVPEIHSEAAASLLDPEIILSAPDLVVPEFGNTLWKKVRRREITTDEAQEILGAFQRLSLELHPSSALLPAAFALATALDRTVHDSLYLALAVGQDCALVTADQKFHGAIAASPFAPHVLWIEHVK